MFLRDGGAVDGGVGGEGRGVREGRFGWDGMGWDGMGWDGMGWGMVLGNDGCLANALSRDE